MAEHYGNIIILNGPSSAGKTTLSRNLQKIWERPLYYLSYDSVDWYMAPFGVTGRDYGIDAVRDFLAVMYESAAAICRSGRDVVIDNCLFDCEDIYEMSQEIMAGCPVTMVRVKLPMDELERREIARGDRTPGKARWQETHITPKEDSAYDVIVDTSGDSMECAREIKRYFDSYVYRKQRDDIIQKTTNRKTIQELFDRDKGEGKSEEIDWGEDIGNEIIAKKEEKTDIELS